MFLRLIRTVQLGLKSLLLHKLRSGLTMLGIVFGVFSVIAMLAIGEGASDQAQKQIVALGARNIIVRSIKPVEGSSSDTSQGGTPRYGLLRSDLRRLQRTIPEVVSAIPIRELNREARYLKNTMQCRLVGCTPEYQELNQLKIRKGRFLTDTDRETRANVVVIAHDVAQKLFPIEDPTSEKAIQVGDIYYSVVGVTEPRTASAAVGGSLSAQEFDKDLYIPIDTFRARIGDQVFTPKQGGMDSEHVELNQITLAVREVKDVIRTSDVVRGTLEKFHPQKDFSVVVPLELLKQAEQLRQIFNVVLGSIAAISLVVGGIGIMNIMLATVTERTREIGIRRALGARRRDIIEQFLTETVVLSGTGGVLGIGLGLLTPLAFRLIREFTFSFVLDTDTLSDATKMFQEMQPVVALWSLPLAFGISVGIGILFGLYPAQAAARLDPIEALRHE
ncbi:MAG: FtsX-like permease family protein [Planctomycetaceae bacterium]|nr:MAG: FtsX-like permease family protein [Planctomycetaceae bacterium]